MFKNKVAIKEYDSEVFIGELTELKQKYIGHRDFISVLISVVEKYNPKPVDIINRLQLLSYYSDDANRKFLLGEIINLISG